MTNEPFDFEEVPFDPASMSTSSLGIVKAVWFKRPWVVATIAVVFVVAVSVLIDLPHHITKAEDASSQNASMKSINVDIQECAFAVNEAFNFYNRDASGTLTRSELQQTTSLLVGDRTACSFASQPVTDLTNNIQVRDTVAGKHIDRLKSIVVTWISNYALAAVIDVQSLLLQPGNTATKLDLAKQASHLTTERALALSQLHDAQTILGLPLIEPDLPVLPRLLGI